MKLAIARDVLLRAVTSAARVADKKTTIPILTNVRLEAKDGSLTVAGTDMDIFVKTRVDADVSEPGAVAAPADKLAAIVKKLPNGDVSLSAGKSGLSVSSGRSRFTLQTLPAEDFPEVALGDETTVIPIQAEKIARLIAETSFAISTEETRYYLNGIFLHGYEGKLRAVATDGHRLALSEVEASTLPDAGVIVPRKTVSEIASLVSKGGDIEIALTQTKIGITAGDTTLISKLIDGTFPDYIRVIPTGNDKILTVHRGDFATAADRVATVSSEHGRCVRLDLTSGSLALEVTNEAVGSASEDISAGYDAEPLTIGFNSKYLAEMLKVAKGDLIIIKFADPGSPAVFEALSSEGWLGVLMPMRV